MRSRDVMQGASFNWCRASFCQTGECVEIAEHEDMVIMRSSAHPDAGYVYFSPKEFGSFLAAAKAGEYDSVH
jgi:Domain of unknown function (DUF397)